VSRLHLLDAKDLHNIADSIGINKEEQAHSDDAVSIDMWVAECRKNGNNPILFYKPQGVESDISGVEKDDFILCLQTESQLDAIKKFGPSNICVDDTHNAPGYKFHLSTILTVDDYGEGVPAAFCISNRVTTSIMTVFFDCVKSKCGIIETKKIYVRRHKYFYKCME
jgi:hypothetical protein